MALMAVDAFFFIDMQTFFEGNCSLMTIRFANAATDTCRRLMEDCLEIFHRGRFIVGDIDLRDDGFVLEHINLVWKFELAKRFDPFAPIGLRLRNGDVQSTIDDLLAVVGHGTF